MDVRYSAGHVITRSQIHISSVAAVHQCQLSVPFLRGRLMSTSEYHVMHWHHSRPMGPRGSGRT